MEIGGSPKAGPFFLCWRLVPRSVPEFAIPGEQATGPAIRLPSPPSSIPLLVTTQQEVLSVTEIANGNKQPRPAFQASMFSSDMPRKTMASSKE